MNRKSVEKYIRAVKPGEKDNLKHQRDLRRELLNSKKFSQHPIKKVLKSYEFAAGLTVFVLATLIIYINTNVNSPSPSELISRLNTTYAGFMLPGKINSFNSNINLYTKEEPQEFSISTLQDYKGKKLFSEVGDPYTNDTLYKLLVIDGTKYISADPKIKFFNVQSSGNKIISTHLNSVTHLSTDSLKVDIAGQESKITIQFPEDAFMTIKRRKNINPELNNMITREDVISINPETDFDKYISTTPLSLLDDLNTSDSIKIFHEESSDTLLVRLKTDLSRLEFKTLVLTLSADSSKESKAFLENISPDNDSALLTWLSNTKPLPDSFRVFLPQKVTVVKINTSDYSIDGAEFSVNKNGQSLKLAEVSFTSHSFEFPDEKLFDPKDSSLIKVAPRVSNNIE